MSDDSSKKSENLSEILTLDQVTAEVSHVLEPRGGESIYSDWNAPVDAPRRKSSIPPPLPKEARIVDGVEVAEAASYPTSLCDTPAVSIAVPRGAFGDAQGPTTSSGASGTNDAGASSEAISLRPTTSEPRALPREMSERESEQNWIPIRPLTGAMVLAFCGAIFLGAFYLGKRAGRSSDAANALEDAVVENVVVLAAEVPSPNPAASVAPLASAPVPAVASSVAEAAVASAPLPAASIPATKVPPVASADRAPLRRSSPPSLASRRASSSSAPAPQATANDVDPIFTENPGY